ncbi:fatty acyl-CoA reductase wat-like [Drosophila obscura]|uniref:fatty acyl-CoA reductase wat-like n=1 Tax=Drosophila obscura TaxID=7282 RepID=UPI001BB188E7|nr:fatty acyl-CoA reductase wat-like [Drosophila obscura]
MGLGNCQIKVKMEMERETETEIQRFYRNKTVFITGGTGFLGKTIIEKLLRTTDVKRIYSLIRKKRGQDIQERIDLWEKEAVFEVLLQSKPDALRRVVPIAGDCLDPDLGISVTSRGILAAEVQIVIHGAATVRFNEPLHVALAINTRATRLLVQLAKQMVKLEAFVHVSTAFSNCVVDHIEEQFYPDLLTSSSEKVLEMTDQLSDQLIDNMTADLLGSFPNTYTYTKALGEDVILREAGDLPVCIFRPAIIIASSRDPVPGWIDNLYGPIALVYGVAYGILRIALVDVNAQHSVVPVDYCANVALATAWKTAAARTSSPPAIYNFAPSEQNLLTYGQFRDKTQSIGEKYAVSKMIWYPFLHCMTTAWLFPLAAFFYHTVPGFALDLALRIVGRKPRMLKIYQKIHTNIMLLRPFTCRSWKFDLKNRDHLWQCMSPQDQDIYQFDMLALDWDSYFTRALRGMRMYLCKEPSSPASIAEGQRVWRRFYLLHRTLQVILIGSAAAVIWQLLNRIFSF